MGRCVCYPGVFLHQRTHLRTHSLQVVHICVYVYMCVYECICIWMRMCVYDIAWHVEALLPRFSICAYVCICMRMYMCVHVCVYMCMCICMYMYICMSVYVYAYTFIYARVGVYMHSCRCILFICTVQSLYYMRVYYRCFLTSMRVWEGVGSGACFSLPMVSACYWRGRLCFGRGRDRGFVLYISLFLQVLWWWVCVCFYTRVHTHKLLGYLMWAQVWDWHLESQKNPDRLKRIIHVDRMCVQSTFVYTYAVLRVLMIWANCFFHLTRLFFLEK